MSPLGKPTPDGDIVLGSRHYGGKTLGDALIWKCPACGVQNEGRKVEQGCGHCGSGDPLKSKAGQGNAPSTPDASETLQRERTRMRAEVRAEVHEERAQQPPSQPTTLKVYRLIEYVFTRPSVAAEVLRPSLVGTLEMGWGTLTATIVDSLDSRQEDRLRMARMQPGVWLANPEAMKQSAVPWKVTGLDPQMPAIHPTVADALTRFMGRPPEVTIYPPKEQHTMEMPDTGPPWTTQQQEFAEIVYGSMGAQATNTLALALSNIAEELRGNMEPEKFLSSEECLQLANALLHQLPAEWQEPEAPPPAPIDEAERVRRQAIRDRLGEPPQAVYREPPHEEM